ncbi:hypothetical protein MSAN_00292900 [Mycena sanguinolenta]|uniref:Protein kinase domain-containing protein n=1 Tax=Mycena sanguinolenta TaxID=230812 RepID=A0A8H6ZAR1_9AGAR|nr:hypothetical protein MSAN_00292900 [Mycena sanguinolenta]
MLRLSLLLIPAGDDMREGCTWASSPFFPAPVMDGQACSPDESQTTRSPASAAHGAYAGAVFSGSHHFTVSGGTFTSVTKNYNTDPTEQSEPSDFRMVPLVDIDLQREIILHTSIVDRQRGRSRVRRVYSAKLETRFRKGNMTVAMYQGDGAEEEWRQDLAKYMHPNIIQIYEAASSNNIYATVFYDDLIPFEDFLCLYHQSPLLTVYVYGFHVNLGVLRGRKLFVFNFPQVLVGNRIHHLDTSFNALSLRGPRTQPDEILVLRE